MVLAVPSPANGVAGVDVSAAFWNAQVRDAVNFVANPPHCVCYQTVGQSIPSSGATATAITFDTNEVDSYSGHSTVTNTSRYVAQVAGWYRVSGSIAYPATSASSYRYCFLRKNGADIPGGATDKENVTTTANQIVAAASREVFLNVGDYVELYALQNSGGAMTTSVTSPQNSYMNVKWEHA
jgi:hypothetical protein